MFVGRAVLKRTTWQRALFSSAVVRRTVLDVAQLPDRIVPRYQVSQGTDLLTLQWPSPPRNILIVKKNRALAATESLIEYANHIHTNYDNVCLIFEHEVAWKLHDSFTFPVYATPKASYLSKKVDMTTTLGGDGTILHASSLFSTTADVPPILSFSMGTLGFLGEWKFLEFKRAFREVYMSGAAAGSHLFQDQKHPHVQAQSASSEEESNGLADWSSMRGKSMGPARSSKILLRNRLKVGVFDATGQRLNGGKHDLTELPLGDIHAMNEVIIHRGANPHLAIIEVFVGGRFLTEAVADGMIISTPTGSTAYSLSSGGSIVHPLVSSLLVTPICPRSLSFRPLVLPASTPVTLRLSDKNRGRELEVSVDGKRQTVGVGVGMEVRVRGEEVCESNGGGVVGWRGGVPCVIRAGRGKGGDDDDDGWVGGLNGLLKFNYPFGEDH